MGEERRKQIAERAWLLAAGRLREAIRPTLERHFHEFTFLDRASSLGFGARYWHQVRRGSVRLDLEIQDFLTTVAPHTGPEPVLWLHRHADETGVLQVPMCHLCRAFTALAGQLGPDLLFAAHDLTLGVCYEVDEYECELRLWGLVI